MNLSDIAIIASIIAGLTSVPFVASTITTEYSPIGTTVLNMSSVDSIPGELSKSLTSDKFEQTYNTPFGKFTIILQPHRIYQELTRPDRRVIVEETPDKTDWKLITQEYTLLVSRTGEKLTDRFTSPDGVLEKTKEMGNVSESVKGNVEDKYMEAKNLLQEELERMEKIKRDYMEIPGTEKIVKLSINEILPNPVGDDADGEFIELYNYGDSEIDLTDWRIRDGGSGYSLSGNIDAGEFLVLWRNETGIALNNNGDDLKLYENDKIVDEVSYSSSTEGKSWARIPDGSGNLEERDPTPGESNQD